MKTTSRLAVVAVLSAVSMSAAAGWGGPCNDAADGRGYGAYPYDVHPIAPPLTEEQRATLAEQQRVFVEQQAKVAQQAMEAQRQHIEQMAANQPRLPEPFAGNRMPFEPSFDQGIEDIQAERAQLHKQMEAYRQEMAARRPARPDFVESKARHEALREQMDARRAEMMKQVETQRKEAQERHVSVRKQFESKQQCREI